MQYDDQNSEETCTIQRSPNSQGALSETDHVMSVLDANYSQVFIRPKNQPY